MTGRIVRAADFERVLGEPAVARSAHFALHHVPGRPAGRAGAAELSTADPEACAQPVDEATSIRRPCRWLGLVVPKRHAREATTRNLLRRQARESFRRHAGDLRCGLWLLRLRRGFDRQRFASAASQPLRVAARGELDELLRRAAR